MKIEGSTARRFIESIAGGLMGAGFAIVIQILSTGATGPGYLMLGLSVFFGLVLFFIASKFPK